MIDNLTRLAHLFESTRTGREITHAADSLVHMDMGAAAVQRHMPESYHRTVARARKWLGASSRHPALDGFPF